MLKYKIIHFLAIMFFNNKFPRRLIVTQKRPVFLLNGYQKFDGRLNVNNVMFKTSVKLLIKNYM